MRFHIPQVIVMIKLFHFPAKPLTKPTNISPHLSIFSPSFQVNLGQLQGKTQLQALPKKA
jgi:hypothetical protein